MRTWESPPQLIPYTFHEVVSVFWNRYPNSKAPHIISEDVLERKIDGDKIVTKKLIIKQGTSFLKAAPKWVSKLTNVKIVPTIEESIFDRASRKLTTYTRNIAWTSIFHMHERCVYTPTECQKQGDISTSRTSLFRAVFVDVNYSAFDPLIERVFLLSFRNSIKRTAAGLMEKLEERFGAPLNVAYAGGKRTQKAAALKGNILQNRKIGFEKA